ncbi:MAG: sugar phosphate isomerase/epimerase [Lentisphaerae bacterium]|nr:sugar phosphate isomerase/epimerase [Lentisphaerota bacterium]
MKLCCNSDFCGGTGDFASRIREIAEAGFTHYFWCHQWNTDFLYTAPEYAEIRRIQQETGIKLLDIHGSSGSEKCWFSTTEYIRLAGVELVKNRIEMLSELEGTGVIVMHAPNTKFPHSSVPGEDNEAQHRQAKLEQEAVFRSLDSLMPFLEKHHTKIAIENLIRDDWGLMNGYLDRYPSDRLGICYDCGHANIHTNNMAEMEKRKSRLIATHLHDNDGNGDQHKPVFSGSIDFESLAKLIASSSYKESIPSFELSMRNTPFWDDSQPNALLQSAENRKAFLKSSYEGCRKFAAMIETAR